MMSSFNPYQQWLGIPDATTAPNHYRLLGLRLFEDAPAVISAAATRLASLVVAQLSSPHSADAQRVLREIETARTCLLKPAAKAEYDAALRQQLSSSPLNPVAAAAHQELTPFPPAAPVIAFRATPAAAPLPPTEIAAAPVEEFVPLPGNGHLRPLAPLPAGAVPAVPPGANVLTPSVAANSGFASTPLPPSVLASSSYAGVESPPLPPPAYASPPVANYPPAVAPAAFAAAAAPMPVAPPPLPAVNTPPPMAIPVAPMAIPAAMPVYGGAPVYAAPIAIPVAQPVARTPQQPVNAEPGPAIVAPRPRLSWRRPQTITPGMLLGGATAVLVVIAVLVVAAKRPDSKPSTNPDQPQVAGGETQKSYEPIERPGPQPQAKEQPARPPQSPEKTVAVNNPPPVPARSPTPQPAPMPLTPTPTPVPDVPDAQKDEAVTKALNSARLALSKSDVPTARSHIGQARKVAARNRAAEIERVDALATYLEEFWRAVREGIKGLEVGGDFGVKDTRVSVVEVKKDALSLRINGRTRDYSINTLPPAIAYVLAERWLKKDQPITKIILGTYQAMHPRGDREEARTLWQAAVNGGAPMAVDLIPELEVPLPAAESAMADAGRSPRPMASSSRRALMIRARPARK